MHYIATMNQKAQSVRRVAAPTERGAIELIAEACGLSKSARVALEIDNIYEAPNGDYVTVAECDCAHPEKHALAPRSPAPQADRTPPG